MRKNALTRMNELWLGLDGLARRLEVRCRAELGSVPPSSAASPASTRLRLRHRWLRSRPSPTAPAPCTRCGPSGPPDLRQLCRGAGQCLRPRHRPPDRRLGRRYFNPIFFCGPYGYGKTHLLNAIAWEAQRLRPDAKVVYLTAERFLSTFVRAVQDRSTAAFKENLRSADMLLLDDVQFIGGKAASQEELLSTLTALIEDGKRIVLAADRAPAAAGEIEPRLRNHLAAGLTCPVEPADRVLKIAVAENRLDAFARMGVVSSLPPRDVLEQLVDRTPGSMRELEARSTPGGCSRFAPVGPRRRRGQSLLGASMRGGPERRITVDEIQKTVADHFNMKQVTLLSQRRTRAIARPRQIAMYLCKQHTTRSYPDIGRRFGGRDHATVLTACARSRNCCRPTNRSRVTSRP